MGIGEARTTGHRHHDLDMLPTSSVKHAPDLHHAHSKSIGDLLVIPLIPTVKTADRLHVRLREFCVPMFLALLGAVFPCGIQSVIFGRPKKKMGWVYTRRIVAGVKNVLASWNLPPVCHFPGNPMGPDDLLLETDHSVAEFLFSSRPQPTLIGGPAFHLFPKAFGKRSRAWHASNLHHIARKGKT